MYNAFKLNEPIGRSYNTAPDDVASTKHLLNGLGYYDVPEFGITPYPDTPLMNGIEQFQRAAGLKVDGVMKPGGETETVLKAMAETLRKQGRNGDTILAHITPAEANLLDSITDGGSINPTTGLPEFYEDNDSQHDGMDGAASDAQAAENDAQDGGFDTDNGGDTAGYGDMRPVNAVNAARKAQEAAARQNAERQRQEAERQERQRQEAERREQQKQEAERLEQQRQEAERQEQQRAYFAQKQKEEEERETLGAGQFQKNHNPNPASNTNGRSIDVDEYGNALDNDGQAATDGFTATASLQMDDQALENNFQNSAFNYSDANRDPAGYNDMRVVNSVNSARVARERAAVATQKKMAERKAIELREQSVQAAISTAARLGISNLPTIVAKDPQAQAALAAALTYSFQDKQQREKTLAAVATLSNKSPAHGRVFGRGGVYGNLGLSRMDVRKTPSQMTNKQLQVAIEDTAFSARVLDATSYTLGGLSMPWMVSSTLLSQVLRDAAKGMQDELNARSKDGD